MIDKNFESTIEEGRKTPPLKEVPKNKSNENNQSLVCEICSPNKKFTLDWKFDMHLTHYHFKNQLQRLFNIHDIFVNSQILTCPLCNQTLKTCMRFLGHLKTHGVIQKMYKDEVEKIYTSSDPISDDMTESETLSTKKLGFKNNSDPNDIMLTEPETLSYPEKNNHSERNENVEKKEEAKKEDIEGSDNEDIEIEGVEEFRSEDCDKNPR